MRPIRVVVVVVVSLTGKLYGLCKVWSEKTVAFVDCSRRRRCCYAVCLFALLVLVLLCFPPLAAPSRLDSPRCVGFPAHSAPLAHWTSRIHGVFLSIFSAKSGQNARFC